MLSRRQFTASLAVAAPGRVRLATFKADATPELGEPLIWVTPAARVADPLWAKGLILEDGATRCVVCAVDWCGLGSSIHALLRRKIAAAAGIDAARVALHVVHQHTAPYIDGDGYELLGRLPEPPLRMSAGYLNGLGDRTAAAVKQAASRLEPFDRIGMGQAKVEQVASARRLFSDGKLVIRYSTGGRDPKMAALPEGPIDPFIRTLTLARGERPLARLHYYATHPQTFCCEGTVTGDFVSAAREGLERDDVFEIYFTGCSGDVTAGKYNDGSVEARAALARRLRQGMEAAIAATRFESAGRLRWRRAELTLPPKPGGAPWPLPEGKPRSGEALYRAAIAAAFAARKQPLDANLLEIGPAAVLHLPGEPMLEFQKHALARRPGRFVAVAGYGDTSPGYLCTDRAFSEGGYEPSAANGGPGTEARVKKAIEDLL